MATYIPLTQGQTTVIDDADFERVSQHRWWAVKAHSGFYAATKLYTATGERRVVQMQRFIMGEPQGLQVDHVSRDTLDNRRANLRVATTSQNKANSVRYQNNQSGFKGVYRSASGMRWVAQLRHAGFCHYLGYHATPEAAARAYDAKAREMQGEFARCNFPA